jgi:hypothetical protein
MNIHPISGGYQDPLTLPLGDADIDILADKKTKMKMKSKLMKMNDDNTIEDVNEPILKKEMLLSNHVFLLHCFDKIFLWVGDKAKVRSVYVYIYIYIYIWVIYCIVKMIFFLWVGDKEKVRVVYVAYVCMLMCFIYICIYIYVYICIYIHV